ncbi:MAG: ABC transporter ATP-binding protein [Pseudomonadota bacterium]
MALLDIRDLSVEFPTRGRVFVAVDAADLTVEPGEIHGLVGESGAGKSTIGAAIMGLLERPGRIASGAITFRGDTISGLDDEAMRALRGRKISMIFQDPLTSLNPLFTIRQQLVETITTHLDVTDDEADARARDLLDRVGIPDPDTRLDQYPHQFSGGMRQRVVIALALCSEPDVIIADEPTTALDVAVQAQILDLIRALTVERQVGVILITHNMGVISDTTDRVTVMYKGEIVETGPTARVMGAPRHPYTQSLIAAVPRPGRKLHRFPKVSYGDADPPPAIDALAGSWPRYQTKPGEPLLEVRGLTKRFIARRSLLPWKHRYFTAIDDVSFDLRAGEVFGIVGESGSGKSTVARVISGLYAADGGSVTFDGDLVSDLSNRAVQQAYRQEIQMIFQDPYSSLNPRMRVDDIVAEPIRHHRLLQGAAIRDRVVDLLEHVGLDAGAALKFPHEFSGGQRQRISIARALATQPRFLICDEPTSALDVSIQAQILNILKDLQEHLGLTMLFISHDLPVVRQMCDRVAVMRDGKVMELQETEALFAKPQTDYTKGLLDLMPRLEALSEGPVIDRSA